MKKSHPLEKSLSQRPHAQATCSRRVLPDGCFTPQSLLYQLADRVADSNTYDNRHNKEQKDISSFKGICCPLLKIESILKDVAQKKPTLNATGSMSMATKVGPVKGIPLLSNHHTGSFHHCKTPHKTCANTAIVRINATCSAACCCTKNPALASSGRAGVLRSAVTVTRTISSFNQISQSAHHIQHCRSPQKNIWT